MGDASDPPNWATTEEVAAMLERDRADDQAALERLTDPAGDLAALAKICGVSADPPRRRRREKRRNDP